MQAAEKNYHAFCKRLGITPLEDVSKTDAPLHSWENLQEGGVPVTRHGATPRRIQFDSDPDPKTVYLVGTQNTGNKVLDVFHDADGARYSKHRLDAFPWGDNDVPDTHGHLAPLRATMENGQTIYTDNLGGKWKEVVRETKSLVVGTSADGTIKLFLDDTSASKGTTSENTFWAQAAEPTQEDVATQVNLVPAGEGFSFTLNGQPVTVKIKQHLMEQVEAVVKASHPGCKYPSPGCKA